MARPRKPTNLLKFSGAFRKNPKREREREGEPIPTGPLGEAPAHFSPQQVAVWQELESQAAPGVLTISDRGAFELLASLVCAYRIKSQLVGASFSDTKLAGMISQLYQQFGMTASSRARVKVNEPKQKETAPTITFASV